MKSVLVILLVNICLCSGKKYTECELSKELFNLHTIPRDDIYKHLCVAHGLQTDEIHGTHFGIYRVGTQWWCGQTEPAGTCNMVCSNLLDDDIADDVACANHIFSSHRLEGWGKSESRCSGYKKIVNDCLNDDAEIIQLDFVDLTTEKEISVALASQSIESNTTRNLLISFTVFILLTTFVLIVWKRETVKDFWGRNIQSDQIKLWENNAAEVL